jgi:fibronectin-binding autotransporter adhesin
VVRALSANKLSQNFGLGLVLGMVLACLAQTAAANTYTWSNSTSGVVDGSGNWDNVTVNWWNSGTASAWNNSTGDTAVFGAGAGSNPYTVTLTNGITVGGITFQSQAYTISGNTLTLAPPSGGTATIAVNAGSGMIGSAVADGGAGVALNKTGAGTLVLNGPDSYTGATAVSGGTLLINGTNATSAISIGLNTALGGAGTISSGTATFMSTKGTLAPGYGGQGGLTLGGLNFGSASSLVSIYIPISDATSVPAVDVIGNITDNSTVVFANPLSQTYGGVISGNGSLAKIGSGVLTITAVQTYAGPTFISGGTVRLAAVPGATLSGFGGGGTNWTTTGYGGTAISGNTLTLTDGNTGEDRSAFYGSPVSVNVPFTATFTYTVLPGTNSQNGFLADGMAFVLQNESPSVVGAPGGGLGYGGITPSAAVQFNLFTYTGAGTNYAAGGAVASSFLGGSSGLFNYDSDPPMQVTLQYDGSNTLTEVIQDVLAPSTSFSTSYSVGSLANVVGGDTAYLGFTGATGSSDSIQTISNFSGTFSVTGGSGGVNVLPPTSDLTMSGGTLDFYGTSQTVNSLSGSGTLTNSNTGAAMLTIGGGTSTTFSGAIRNGAGTMALTMDGAGTLVLSGTNTFSGGTIVNAGTLILDSPAAVLDGSSLTVGEPGALAVFAPASAASAPSAAPAGAAPVPEPGTLVLLLAAIWSSRACHRFSRRSFPRKESS